MRVKESKAVNIVAPDRLGVNDKNVVTFVTRSHNMDAKGTESVPEYLHWVCGTWTDLG